MKTLTFHRYKPHSPDPNSEDNDYASYDNFAVASVSFFQYIGTAIIFSKGAPYRKSIFTNSKFNFQHCVVYLTRISMLYSIFATMHICHISELFLLVIVILTCSSIYLVVNPAPQIVDLFEMEVVPSMSFRAMLLLVAAANFMLSFLAEVSLQLI